MKHLASLILVSLVFVSSLAVAGNPDAITGVWTTPEGRAKVEIVPCGSLYCGKIIAMKEPNYPAGDDKGMAGRPKIDRENPDPQLRNRPLLGLPMLEGFSYTDEDRWEGGTIYDPKNGKTYKCKISLPEANQLKVRGFIGISLLGRTETWTR